MPFASNGPVDIYYETFGQPSLPALLLVNGFGSQCINYRAAWCERFVEAGFFVIRMDNRDVGLSTKCVDLPQYGVGDMADDCVAVLSALGIESAHVMGLSMGGLIVQQLAIEHADRLLSVTSVMSTTGDPDVGRPTPEALAFLTGPPAKSKDEFVARHVEGNAVYGSPACQDPTRLAAEAGEAYERGYHPDGLGRQMKAVIAAGSRTEALGSVKLPALVIHGDQDKLIHVSGGERTASAIPGARFVVFEGMGHDYPPAYWDRWVAEVVSIAGLA